MRGEWFALTKGVGRGEWFALTKGVVRGEWFALTKGVGRGEWFDQVKLLASDHGGRGHQAVDRAHRSAERLLDLSCNRLG